MFCFKFAEAKGKLQIGFFLPTLMTHFFLNLLPCKQHCEEPTTKLQFLNSSSILA